MHSLSNRGMIGDIRSIPTVQPVDPGEVQVDNRVVQKGKKVPDLSLIKEEPEETQNQEGLVSLNCFQMLCVFYTTR